jgi:glutamyl-tRNA synthetase
MSIRLRFAPSPTGSLHIGGLRTALFAYVIAKRLEGKIILRIEDTDQKRKVEGAVDNFLDIFNWLGIKFDEGFHVGGNYGPYIQTDRLNIYKKHVNKLLNESKVYYCFCTSERLQNMREDQQFQKLPPKYDRKCRNLTKGEVKKKLEAGQKFVIRQKMPTEGDIKVYDELRGEIIFKARELEDHILIKSNGIPTYQFANVVDDHLMGISHVTRSEEWIPSFPKNILLYELFGWKPPKFIHFPAVLNKGGGKLSKRHGDVTVEDYRKKGYLPEALINFCALLGWNPKDDNEILSLEEIIKKIEIKDMRTSGAIFDVEKLDYLNGYYIRHKDLEKLVELCKPYLKKNIKNEINPDFLKNIIRLEQERLKKLSDISELTKNFFKDKLIYSPNLLVWKKMDKKDVKINLEELIIILEDVENKNWNSKMLEEKIINYIKGKNEKIGNYLWPMRVALTGEKASPGPFDIAEVIGRDKTILRIKEGINLLSTDYEFSISQVDTSQNSK